MFFFREKALLCKSKRFVNFEIDLALHFFQFSFRHDMFQQEFLAECINRASCFPFSDFSLRAIPEMGIGPSAGMAAQTVGFALDEGRAFSGAGPADSQLRRVVHVEDLGVGDPMKFVNDMIQMNQSGDPDFMSGGNNAEVIFRYVYGRDLMLDNPEVQKNSG